MLLFGPEPGTRTAGSALPQPLPLLLPRSLLQFPLCPGYLCHGNCARLPAQTQIPPLVSLFARMMTQQLLQGSQPPPSSSSVIHYAHQTK
ncbi:Valine--tRNA ligase [Dissostichus eleginoides]|uniref:Valine--tRNA ligase n=1 Tax=Dissostichus eleginoides TaxID=100907 RepID=A0AAD9CJH4_DISEL|nr:Valine--tRNA ligase [Dissostichus eleginoides]